MSTTLRCVSPVALATLLCALTASALADTSSCFVKKEGWLESTISSREALVAQEADAVQKAEAAKQADPALKAFEPQELKIIGKEEPRHLQIHVKGMKELFIGTSTRPIFLANAQQIDAAGKSTAVSFEKLQVLPVDRHGHVRNNKSHDWHPPKWGDQTYENAAILERAEVLFALNGKVDVLDLVVGVSDKREKNPTTVWVNWQSGTKQEQQHAKALETIEDEVQAAFPDPVSYRERRLEEAAGIWRQAWKSGDWAELAGRYARACGKTEPKARELAKNCKSLADLLAVRNLFYVQHAGSRLKLAEETLAFVQKSAPRPEMATQLKSLQAQLPEAETGTIPGEALYAKACTLRREIILSHPLLDFPKLLVNKRSDRLPEHMCDQYLGRHSQAAPGLVVLENWKTQPKETVLLEGKLPQGALIQPSLSFDGKRVLFAFADHSSDRKGDLRGYFIYEYNIEKGQVRQVTGTSRDPMQGQLGRETVLIEDMNPCYLPDGGIAFISTRSQQYGRCHGSRYVPSYTLHRAELDGSDIHALSYNESNEWAPSVLHDGSIVYCRWDYVNRHDVLFQSLWTIRPDGTQTAHYYGNNTPAPCMISEPQQIPGTTKSICTAAPHHGQTMGTIIKVDPYISQDGGTPLTWITPELSFPESGIPQGITKAAMPPIEDAQPGRASTPWPLSEDLYLCTYQHGNEHAIYLVDTLGGRELICWDPKISCFDPIPLRPRTMPPAVPHVIATKGYEKSGVLFVQDVYQSTTPYPRGTIKSMRINQIISQPTRSAPPRSFAHNELVKKVLGTVPVNEDGSVACEAPANTPLQLQLLDANGMTVMTMRSLLYVQPGEKAACVGCHEHRYDAPPPAHLIKADIRKITPPVGPQWEGGMSFVRNVQPVLDRYCICCHGPGTPAAGIDLTGGFTKLGPDGKPVARTMGTFSVAYESLINLPGLVRVAPRNGESYPSKPNDYFAAAGRLAQFLLNGHPDKSGKKLVEIDRVSFQRMVDWMDLNAQFYGDYSHNRMENQPALPDGEKALRAAIEKRFGPELAKQPFATLVNVANPAESRILMAPVAATGGGWGQISANAFKDQNDPAFVEMSKLVEGSITPLQYHDIAGTCGRGHEHCVCGTCWAREDADARRLLASQKAAPDRQAAKR